MAIKLGSTIENIIKEIPDDTSDLTNTAGFIKKTDSITGNSATATKLANKRNITIGNSTKQFDGSADISMNLGEIGAAASNHNHDSAYLGKTAKAADSDKLDGKDSTAFAAASHSHTKSQISDFAHNHDASNVTSGTLAVARGGTGKTTLKDSANSLINSLDTGASTPQDADYYVSQFVAGGTTTTTYHRRPMSALWAYIKGKTDSLYLGKTAKAADSDKLDGKDISYFAISNHNHDNTYAAKSHIHYSNFPAAPCIGVGVTERKWFEVCSYQMESGEEISVDLLVNLHNEIPAIVRITASMTGKEVIEKLSCRIYAGGFTGELESIRVIVDKNTWHLCIYTDPSAASQITQLATSNTDGKPVELKWLDSDTYIPSSFSTLPVDYDGSTVTYQVVAKFLSYPGNCSKSDPRLSDARLAKNIKMSYSNNTLTITYSDTDAV